VARFGVTVNCVCPGFIDTDMLRGVPEHVLERLLARIPLGRFGDADEIARGVRALPGGRWGLHHRHLPQHQRGAVHVNVAVGDRAERRVVVSDELLEHFAQATGDRNPIHFDDAYAAETRFGGRIAHGMLVGGLISALLANQLPGPGSVYLSQELRFRAPVRIGDEVRCEAEVTELDERSRVTLATRAWVGETLVADGTARVLTAP
jgi:3-hydroxybutyryl-CoA dehydratase